jgi:hypothetical protein
MEQEYIEIWKPIEGYENYQVSNFGRVKNNKNHIMSQDYTKCYCRVHLYKNGKGKHHLIHRLVAQAFIPNPNKLPQVNHKDENKDNNNVNNLEWCTAKYNNNYGNRNKLSKIKQINDVIKSKPIDVCDLNMNYITTFPSIEECERKLGVNQSNIIKVCKGIYKQCNDYIFRYHNEQERE